MKPSYKLSGVAVQRDANLATKPRQVETWLERLPSSDVVASADLLAAYLSSHNQPDQSSGFRKQLLNLTESAVGGLLQAFEAEFSEMSFPLSSGQQQRVDCALRLLSAVLDMNKRLILDFAEYSPRLFGENPLPGFISAFLHTARRILDICYQCHRLVPDGLWLDIHQTGSLIIEAGLNETADSGRPEHALIDIYTALLLEVVADPYHFSRQERLWIGDVIDRFGGLAKVERVHSITRNAIYGIPVDQDRPPYPLSWQKEAAPECDLVLITTQLARKLALLLNQLARGHTDAQTAQFVQHQGYQDVLERLKLLWSGSMLRTTPRRAHMRQVRGKALLGFHAVYSYLAGGGGSGPEATAIACQLINESLGGMAVSVEKATFRLKVGMLVLIGNELDDGFTNLGLVRWFKTAGNGIMMLGIKFIPGRSRVATIITDDARHVYPGLLMQVEHDGRQTPVLPHSRLVLPAVRMDAETGVEIRLDMERFRLRLVEKLEGSDDVTLFRCHAETGR
jgi:hypothetical protein